MQTHTQISRLPRLCVEVIKERQQLAGSAGLTDKQFNWYFGVRAIIVLVLLWLQVIALASAASCVETIPPLSFQPPDFLNPNLIRLPPLFRIPWPDDLVFLDGKYSVTSQSVYFGVSTDLKWYLSNLTGSARCGRTVLVFSSTGMCWSIIHHYRYAHVQTDSDHFINLCRTRSPPLYPLKPPLSPPRSPPRYPPRSPP